jgi:pimeloyl-ACP methyl ester carboxylesterase
VDEGSAPSFRSSGKSHGLIDKHLTRRRLVRGTIASLGLVVLWLAISTVAIIRLTGRPRPRFDEPVPFVTWGKLVEQRFQTRDGHDIGAWFIDGHPDAASILILHGNKGSRTNSLKYAEFLAPAGFAILMPSLRCHGDSSGNFHDIGYGARQDVISAVEFLEKRRPGRPIIVLGTSLGAATATYASEELRHRIRGYILESPYQDLKTAVWNRTHTYLPSPIHQIAYAGLRLAGLAVLPHLDEISPSRRSMEFPRMCRC